MGTEVLVISTSVHVFNQTTSGFSGSGSGSGSGSVGYSGVGVVELVAFWFNTSRLLCTFSAFR